MWLRLALRQPCTAATVPATRHAVDCALIAIDVADECRREVVLALSEACANAVRHAGPSANYTVTVTADDDRCVVDVADAGKGSPPARLVEPMPDGGAEHGRGLHIIRELMDHAEIIASPPGGLVIRMIKKLVWRRAVGGRMRSAAPS